MERCTTALSIREMQVETARRHPPQPLARPLSADSEAVSAGEDVARPEPCAPRRVGNGQLPWKMVRRFLTKLKTHVPADPPLGERPKERKAGSRDSAPHAAPPHGGISHVAATTHVPFNGWARRTRSQRTMECYAALRGRDGPPHAQRVRPLKWDEPAAKGQILRDAADLTRGVDAARGGQRGRGGLTGRVADWQDGKALDICFTTV